MLGGPLEGEEEQGVIKNEAYSYLPFKNILPNCNYITSVSWVKIDGITNKPEKCFVMTNYINDEPCFALIYKIIYLEKTPVFICKTVETIEHNLHFNSYEILVKENFKIYRLEELFVHGVYHAHLVKGKYFIICLF